MATRRSPHSEETGEESELTLSSHDYNKSLSRPLMPPMRGDGESLTAAILIDAIITHQITQSNVDSSLPGRELHRPNYVSFKELKSSRTCFKTPATKFTLYFFCPLVLDA